MRLLGDLDGKALSSLKTTSLKNGLTAAGTHPTSKPVHSLTAAHLGLIGSLRHGNPLSLHKVYCSDFHSVN